MFLLSQVSQQAQPKAAGFLSKAQGKVRTVRSSVVRKQATCRQPTFDNNEADFHRGWPVEEVYQPLCLSKSNHAVV